MCGIFLYKGNSIDDGLLHRSALKIKHRGPDFSSYQKINDVFMAFHRLSIVDLSHDGNQPFVDSKNNRFVLCNGEIYNHRTIRKKFPDWIFKSRSDCEVLLPFLASEPLEFVVRNLDAEFSFVCYEQNTNKVLAARDPLGIRPLFYGLTGTDGEIAFASEAKALTPFCTTVMSFPPGNYYNGEKFVPYNEIYKQEQRDMTIDDACSGIRKHLKGAVAKRLEADAPIGFLLSGGLDSSLVCALASKMQKTPIRTFSIGSAVDAIDNSYAEMVARHIGAEHTTVTFTHADVEEALKVIIYALETWDITTIRASIGMYLICKHIKENTNIRVLLSGEVSDELFGYKYTDFAPSPSEFQNEAKKRIEEIHMYDVLRADRCIAAHGIEARVPFGDIDFVRHVMSIPAKMKMNSNGIGKFLLRKSFENDNLLPQQILFREKAAFSDAVGHSVVDEIKKMAEKRISDYELRSAQNKYKHCPPKLKEALLYRIIFEDHYNGHAKMIKDYWLPNKKWENCNVLDPSARVLPNYGSSGQ